MHFSTTHHKGTKHKCYICQQKDHETPISVPVFKICEINKFIFCKSIGGMNRVTNRTICKYYIALNCISDLGTIYFREIYSTQKYYISIGWNVETNKKQIPLFAKFQLKQCIKIF